MYQASGMGLYLAQGVNWKIPWPAYDSDEKDKI